LPEYDADKNSAISSAGGPEKDYNPLDGFSFYFDYVSRLFDSFGAMKFVFGIYNLHDSVIEPLLIDQTSAEPDTSIAEG
jgi:hypothetical protein